MIKNKILFTVLFAFIANLFTQTSFTMQKSTPAPEASTKSIKTTAPKKFNLNTELTRRLILKELTKDESSDRVLEQISYLIISIILGGATTAILNHDKIIPLFEYIKNKHQQSKSSAEDQCLDGVLKFLSNFFPGLDPDRSADFIKIGATFTASSLIYYILLNVLFHYMNKKDNSEETILRLMTILGQLNK